MAGWRQSDRVVDADLIPISYDLVYGDEWVRGPGNPDQRTLECLLFERGIATPFMRAGNEGGDRPGMTAFPIDLGCEPIAFRPA